jgi:hypothetical protein
VVVVHGVEKRRRYNHGWDISIDRNVFHGVGFVVPDFDVCVVYHHHRKRELKWRAIALKKNCPINREPVEQSFKDAYREMNRKYIQLNAMKLELEKRLQVTEEVAVKNLTALDKQLAGLEEYTERLCQYLDCILEPHILEAIEGYMGGRPKMSIRIAKKTS